MTDELIAELRVLAEYIDAAGEAADALEAQARRIAELEADIDRDDEWAKGFIEKTDARIEELKAALRPFAELDAHWAGDKMPLQPKSVMLNPLPILYAIKALKND